MGVSVWGKQRSTGAAIIMPEANVAAMNEHLAEISVSIGAIAVLVLDGAGWHSSPRLMLPENIVLVPPPTYAPELNPMDNVWEFMRSNFLATVSGTAMTPSSRHAVAPGTS
jgi:DDE superfamily endonuclease